MKEDGGDHDNEVKTYNEKGKGESIQPSSSPRHKSLHSVSLRMNERLVGGS